MKVLIVAHPDDELLWFNPLDYNKIIVVFSDRDDIPGFGERRRKAMSELPYKVECWNIKESGYHHDKSKELEHQQNFFYVCEKLEGLLASEVTTHNAGGEYMHPDHILVHNACMATLNCLVNGKDPSLYRKAKEVYEKNDVWTWF